VFAAGIEKIVLNTAVFARPELIGEVSSVYGSQAVIISIDVKKTFFGKQTVWSSRARFNTGMDPVTWAKEAARMGAGEILITSVDREGTWNGFDLDLVRRISEAVPVPVIAHGGAGRVQDIKKAVTQGRASAVAVGSMVVFQKKGMGVLVNFPHVSELSDILNRPRQPKQSKIL
jgi:cyclase